MLTIEEYLRFILIYLRKYEPGYLFIVVTKKERQGPLSTKEGTSLLAIRSKVVRGPHSLLFNQANIS
jgi:hypothetical protein